MKTSSNGFDDYKEPFAVDIEVFIMWLSYFCSYEIISVDNLLLFSFWNTLITSWEIIKINYYFVEIFALTATLLGIKQLLLSWGLACGIVRFETRTNAFLRLVTIFVARL